MLQSPIGNPPRELGHLLRWLVAAATLTVPQAAGPVAFSLVTLVIYGDASGGAAIILAMTIAQVAGAIPMTRLGHGMRPDWYFRLLVAFRSLALVAMAICAHLQAHLFAMIVFGALAGLVNGAAYGYLRSMLNGFTTTDQLPRVLGIASTLNEVTFVLAPVLASVIGSFSPILVLLAITALGILPAIAIPRATISMPEPSEVHDPTPVISPAILLWLTCATAGGATVAAIEIGAVALAISFGYQPAMAILLTVPLCLASVAGGVWISVRNKMLRRKSVIALLGVMAMGATLVALEHSLPVTMIGAVLVGSVLAPLGTYYALVLDGLAPPRRRPEVFALLRTANAVGVIVASAVLTVASLSAALAVVAVMMVCATLLVWMAPGPN